MNMTHDPPLILPKGTVIYPIARVNGSDLTVYPPTITIRDVEITTSLDLSDNVMCSNLIRKGSYKWTLLPRPVTRTTQWDDQLIYHGFAFDTKDTW